MLLTNWLRSIACKCRPVRSRSIRHQRSRAFNRQQPALSRNPVGVEQLEDRTMLTSMISIDDISRVEGDVGATILIFTVTRTGDTPGDLDESLAVDFTTLDGSATSNDNDYVAQNGTLDFEASATSTHQTKIIQIEILGDYTQEGDESFQILLSTQMSGATFLKNTGIVTIFDDEYHRMEETQTLAPPAPVIDEDHFGQVITIDGDYMVVGAPDSDLAASDAGAVYIYHRDRSGTPDEIDDTWSYHSTLSAFDGAADDHFGKKIAISGDTLVIGASGTDLSESDEGAAYVYRLSGGLWQLEAKLTASDASAGDNFGSDVAIENDLIVIGADLYDVPSNNNSGAAYIFTRSGTNWSEDQILTATEFSSSNNNFGTSVAIENGEVFVAARRAKIDYYGAGVGSIFTFQNNAGTWEVQQQLTLSFYYSSDYAGPELCVSGNHLAIISDDHDHVYLYENRDGNWEFQNSLSVTAKMSISSIDLNETTLVIGATAVHSAANYAGEVSKYKLIRDKWTLTQRYNGSSVDNTTGFGTSIAMADSQIITGAPNTDSTVLESGQLHVLGPFIPGYVISNVNRYEGDSGQNLFEFTIERRASKAGDLNFASTIDFTTLDGTATVADGDYQALSGTLTFNADPDAISQTQTVTIVVNGDEKYEREETFTLELSNPTNGAQIIDAVGEAEILGDDYAIVGLTESEYTVNESEGTLELTVRLESVFVEDVVVRLFYEENSARSGDDFGISPLNTATIPAGQLSTTISIEIVDDNITELDEQFHVFLGASKNARPIAYGGTLVKITDDDIIELSIEDVVVYESQPYVDLFVTASKPVYLPILVHYTTQNNTANNPEDYTTVDDIYKSVRFGGDQTSGPIRISIVDQPEWEPDETFFVNLTGVSIRDNYSVPVIFLDNQAKVTIIDDDQPDISISDVTVDEAAGTAVLTVSISTAAPTPIMIDYATSDDSAAQPDDYTPTSGTLTFNPGELTKTITVSITDDFSAEEQERFFVDLSNLQTSIPRSSITKNRGIINIIDDDQYYLTINDQAINETDGTATLTVTLDRALSAPLTVDYSTINQTASAGNDFQETTGTLIFAPGDLTGTITVQIMDDTTAEEQQSFFVKLSNPQSSRGDISLINSQGEITITDNDHASISINDVTVSEWDGSTVVTVTLDQPAEAEVNVAFTTSSGSATETDDFSPASGTITFAPGETSKEIEISINNDLLVEATETFLVILDLSNLENNADIQLADTEGEVTITDNDKGHVSIRDISVYERSATWVLYAFLYRNVDTVVSVDFATADLTAVSPDDYLTTTGTITFNPGERQKLIYLPIIDNSLIEPDKSFLVNLSNLSVHPDYDVSISNSQAEVTILEDDYSASISVDDIWVDESAGMATVTVAFDQPVEHDVSIDYTTSDRAATSPEDYLAQSGTLTFIPGEQYKTISIPIIYSNMVEGNSEIFVVDLSNIQASGGRYILEDDQARVYIVDHDIARLSVSDLTINENEGVATITLTLDNPVDVSLYVDMIIREVTAKRHSDYNHVTLNTLSFDAGEQVISFDISIVNSDLVENDEVFYFDLDNLRPVFTSGTHNIVIEDNRAIITILDDDQAHVSITDLIVNEGAGTAEVTISLDKPVDSAISLSYTTDDLTTVSTEDYISQSGSLTFSKGQQSKTISIPLVDSDSVEADEKFLINLFNLQSNGLDVVIADDQAEVTIRDNDEAHISIEDTSVNEADGTVEITVSLDKPTTTAISIDYATADQSALETQDYLTQTGTLMFAPVEQSKTFTVSIVDNNLLETDETFFVNLTNIQANGANIIFADDQAEVKILDDDLAQLSINDLSVNEIDGTASVTVTLDNPIYTTLNIDFTITDQSASNSTDYRFQTGTLTFNPGEQSKTIDIEILNDSIVEGFETFLVQLSNLQTTSLDVILEKDEAIVTIVDDDQAMISINDVTVDEFAGTTTLKVSLNRAVYSTVSVDYLTADSTALNSTDYSSLSGTLTFFRGQQSRYITIPILDSSLVESSETFLVNLTNMQANGAQVTFADDQGEVTILDNEKAILTINDVTVDESAGTVDITVSLDSPIETSVSVDFATVDQTAINSDDYQTTSGTLTFNPGEQTKTITFPVVYSDLVELDETFLINLTNLQSNGANVIPAVNQATVTITDNNQANILIDDVSVDENAGTVSLTVSLDAPVDSTVSIDFATSDQTAAAPDDYQSTSGTLTFNPGEQSKTITVAITDSDLLEPDETFLVNLFNLQANGRNVTLADNQAEVTIFDDEIGTAEINFRVVNSPTNTSPNGEAGALPENRNWVSEWSSYWVEIWINANNPTEQGVFSAALDFNYNTEYTSATEIEFGTAFTQNRVGSINDLTGTVEGLSAETNIPGLGIDNPLLFARIKFEPLTEDQVALDLEGNNIGPYDLGLGVSAQQVSLDGDIPASTTLGAFSGTSIYANPLDFNDDDEINFRDLTIFASVYNSTPSQSSSDYSWFADINQSNEVNFRDLVLFASNYGKSKLSRTPVNYPANYPDAWNDLLRVEAPTEPSSTPHSISQSTAETVLENVVNQISPALTPDESETLKTIEIQVVDLGGDNLGRAAAGTIYIDLNASGYGWFVDNTPADHSEFSWSSALTLIALPDCEAAGKIDLQTVILHELRHILGYEHESEGIMQDSLAPGVRNIQTWDDRTDHFFSELTQDFSLTNFLNQS